MRKEFRLPDAGEGLTEAEILTWHVAPGDEVAVNQPIVEVETAKAAVELPSPFAGTVIELLVEPGATVAVGTPIVSIDTAGPAQAAGEAAATSAPAPADEQVPNLVGYGPRDAQPPRRRSRNAAPEPEPAPAAPVAAADGSVVPLAKPPVRKLARELGVDLRTVVGSGPGGVITRDDLARPEPTNGERREPVRGVRKAMAAAMVASAFTAPHVTEFLTVDVTAMIELRDRLRESPEFAGVKLTPLAFAAKAVCLAARRTPEINSSWDEAAGEIVYHGAVHLGIAAATPRGLVVPKIRNADSLALRDLATVLTELTETARAGKTPPEDMVGGTLTITNVGVFGVDTGTPIINPGEAAILALGAVKPAPWVVDGQLAVRTVCQLAVSFDHRLVDGAQGSRFLADVGTLLSDPGRAVTY